MMIKRGKPVWAVPGPITSSVSAGTNWLISTNRAKIYLTPGPSPEFRRGGTQGGEVDPILELIRDDGLEADEIARKLGEDVAKVGSQLSLLTLSGEVEEREGKYYMVSV